MTCLLRKNLKLILNKNLYPVIINMRLIDYTNINLIRNDFIIKTVNNKFIIKSKFFEEQYDTDIPVINKNNNVNYNKISSGTEAFILKKILTPAYNISFSTNSKKYSVTINTDGEIPLEWIMELNNIYRLNYIHTGYYKSSTTYNCEKILNNMSDDEIIDVNNKLLWIMQNKIIY